MLQLTNGIEGFLILLTTFMTVLFIFILSLILYSLINNISIFGKREDLYGEEEENIYDTFHYLKKISIIGILLCLFISLIPTKQTILLFSRVYFGKKVVNNITLDKKLEKVNAIIDLQINKCLKDLQDEAKDGE